MWAFPAAYQEEVPWKTVAMKQVNIGEQKFLVPCLFRKLFSMVGPTHFIVFPDQIERKKIKKNQNPETNNTALKTLIQSKTKIGLL